MPWPLEILEVSNEEKHTKSLREALKCLILESLPFSHMGFIRAECLRKVSELITMFNTKNILCYLFRALQALTLEDTPFYNYKFSSHTIKVLQEVLDSIVF